MQCFGYSEITVAGLSLGGLISIKLSYIKQQISEINNIDIVGTFESFDVEENVGMLK